MCCGLTTIDIPQSTNTTRRSIPGDASPAEKLDNVRRALYMHDGHVRASEELTNSTTQVTPFWLPKSKSDHNTREPAVTQVTSACFTFTHLSFMLYSCQVPRDDVSHNIAHGSQEFWFGNLHIFSGRRIRSTLRTGHGRVVELFFHPDLQSMGWQASAPLPGTFTYCSKASYASGESRKIKAESGSCLV